MPDLEYISPRTNRKYVIESIDPTYTPTDDDYRQAALKVEQIETGTKQSALESFGANVAQGITTVPGTLVQGAGALTGLEGVEKYGKSMAESARQNFPTDPVRREDFSSQAGQAVGQALAQLGMAVGTGGIGLGTKLVLGSSALMGAASGAERADVSELTGARKMARVYGSALTELASERLFGLGSKNFFSPTQAANTLAQKGKRFAGTTFGEGAEESVAGFGNNIVDNLSAVGLDIPTPDILSLDALKSYGEQGLLGMVGGTVFAGAQLAMGNTATQETVTRKTAVRNGQREDVTGVPDSKLAEDGFDLSSVEETTVLDETAANAVNAAPTGGIRNILTRIFGNDAEIPIGATPEATQEQKDIFEAAAREAAAKKAAAAAAAPTAAPTAAAAPAPAAAAPAPTVDVDPFVPSATLTPEEREAVALRVVENIKDFGNLSYSKVGGLLGRIEKKLSQGVTDENEVFQGLDKIIPAKTFTRLKDLMVSAEGIDSFKKVLTQIGQVKNPMAETAEAPIIPPAVEPTPTPTPDATQIGQVPESNLGQYPDGNEVGTATETGDRNRPVESGKVEQTVAQEQAVTPILPSGAVPTGSLPTTPMTGVSGGVAAAAPGVSPAAGAAPVPAPAPAPAPASIPAPTTVAPPTTPVSDTSQTRTAQSLGIADRPDAKIQSEAELRAWVKTNIFSSDAQESDVTTQQAYDLLEYLKSDITTKELQQITSGIDPIYGNYDALPVVLRKEIETYSLKINDQFKFYRYIRSLGSNLAYSFSLTGAASGRALQAAGAGSTPGQGNSGSVINASIVSRQTQAAKNTGGLLNVEDVEQADDINPGVAPENLKEAFDNTKAGENVVVDVLDAQIRANAAQNPAPDVPPTDTRPVQLTDVTSKKNKIETPKYEKIDDAFKARIRGIPPTMEEGSDGKSAYHLAEIPLGESRTTLSKANVMSVASRLFRVPPKNLVIVDTETPNPDGKQYAGKVDLEDGTITINLRNVNGLEHLTRVLQEEVDHLVYQDPEVQMDLKLLSENLPQSFIDEVQAAGYLPSQQKEEAVIRFARKLANDAQTKSLWNRFIESVKAAFRRLFNSAPTEYELTQAANSFVSKAAEGYPAQSVGTGQRFALDSESQRIDREYLAAVEAGDMETAQRINKEVAKSAGYSSVVYRGIEKGSPVNDSGTVWATSNFDAASSYASDVFGYENPDVVTFYAKTDNIPKYDIRKLSESELEALSPDQFGNPQSIGVYANSDDSMGYNQTVYHLPVNNVKSANAVERDDAGNIIPPSKRFQKTSDDIRYSLTPEEQQPEPEADENSYTPEDAAIEATPKTPEVNVKPPKKRTVKSEADQNIDVVKSFIKAFKKSQSKSPAEQKPKNAAAKILTEATNVTNKDVKYGLTEKGRDYYLESLTQKLVNIGVPKDVAYEGARHAWAKYSVKKQSSLDAAALRKIEQTKKDAQRKAQKAQAAADRQQQRDEATIERQRLSDEAAALKEAQKPDNTAQKFIDQYDESQTETEKAEGKVDPVAKALRDIVKVDKIGVAFDISAQAKHTFLNSINSQLIQLGVSPTLAWTASNRAWIKYQTKRTAKVAKTRQYAIDNGISSLLSKELATIPVYLQRDPDYVKAYIKKVLLAAGLSETVADASVPMIYPQFATILADTREAAMRKFIEGNPKTAEKARKKPTEFDKLLKATRLGANNPEYAPSTPFAKENKWKAFTKEDYEKLVELERQANDETLPPLIRGEKIREMAKLADERMNDISALRVLTEFLVNNTLSGLGTLMIQIYTPTYSMGTRMTTDGVRGLINGDPKRFIASIYSFFDAFDTAIAEFTYAYGKNSFRYGQQAELERASQLRRILEASIEQYNNAKSPTEKFYAGLKIAMSAPDYVRRAYSSLDTASQSVFIKQFQTIGGYDILKSSGKTLQDFKDILKAKRSLRDHLIAKYKAEGEYSPSQIRLIVNEAVMSDYGDQIVKATDGRGAQTYADLKRTSPVEGQSEVGMADLVQNPEGHVIPAMLDFLTGLQDSINKHSGADGAGDLVFRTLIGYPSTALKVLNRSLYYSPIGIYRILLNKKYESEVEAGFVDPNVVKRRYSLLETQSQKDQRFAEAVTGTAIGFLIMAIMLADKDKPEEERNFKIHNLGPANRAEKQIWRAAGNVDQSIQWRASKDSPWISISWAKAGLEALTPILMPLGTIYDVANDSKALENTAADRAMQLAGGVMGSMNRPLSGLQDIGEILTGEKTSLSKRNLASFVGFRASGLIPFSSLLKTSNKLAGPRDQSTATSSLLAQLPIAGPSLTEPGLNVFGDSLGATPNEMTYKLPIAPVQLGLRRDQVEFYENVLSKKEFPPVKLRSNFEKSYGVVTDSTWRQFVEIRGKYLKSQMMQRWESLDKLSPKKYDDILGDIARSADDKAVKQLKLKPVKK